MAVPNKYIGFLPVKMTNAAGVLPKIVQHVPGEFNDWRPDDNIQANPTTGGKVGQDWRTYKTVGPHIAPGQNP